MKVRFDIKLVITETPDVTFSEHEIENLLKREFRAYGLEIWDLVVRKKMNWRGKGVES